MTLTASLKLTVRHGMYNKLFTKILDSSIWLAPDPTRLVWITLIAAMDEDGNAMFACVDNLAIRARVTLEQAEIAVRAFESPDPKSGDPENEGRRIERFPGGWHVLNAHKYRAMVTKTIIREQTRLRTARWRAKQAVTQGDAPVTRRDENVTPSEAVSEAVSEAEKKPDRRTARAVDEPSDFVLIRQSYPKRSGGQRWGDALKFFKRRVQEGEKVEVIIEGVKRYAEYAKATGIERTERVQQAATFLGDNRGYLEAWQPPPRAMSPVERINAKLSGNSDGRTIESSQPSLEPAGRLLR